MKSKSFWVRAILQGLMLLTLISMGTLGQTSSVSDKPHVWGKVTAKGQPVEGAKIELHSFSDEACVKLAKASGLSESEKKTLDKCSSELAVVVTDGKGEYRFPIIQAGWYKLIIQWDLDAAPAFKNFPVQWQGEFVIAYYVTKSEPKKYSALAQGEIFRFEGDKPQRKDFNWENSPEPMLP